MIHNYELIIPSILIVSTRLYNYYIYHNYIAHIADPLKSVLNRTKRLKSYSVNAADIRAQSEICSICK